MPASDPATNTHNAAAVTAQTHNAVTARVTAATLDDVSVRPSVSDETGHGSSAEPLVFSRPRSSTPFGVPRQLPIAPFRFVGRSAHLAELDRLVEDSVEQTISIVVSAITGPAGVGKTALMLYWAHRSKNRFPDGHLYVNLQGFGPVPPVQPELALDAFVRALGVPGERVPIGLEQLAGLYRSLLDGRRMLIVLDNASDADQVRPLLPGAPGAVVIITSRNKLSGLVAREGAHRIILNPLSIDEATILVANIVGERARVEESAAYKLVNLCDRLPLALRIAAERVASHPYATLTGLVTDLAVERNRLDFLTTDDISTGMRTVLSWSYRALSDDAARALTLLSLHPGPEFGTLAAAAVIGKTVDQCRKVLEKLTNAHLLEPVGWERFRFHDLIRTYANERSDTDDLASAAAIRRVLVFYLVSASSMRTILIPHNMPISVEVSDEPPVRPAGFTSEEAVAWHEVELANLMAAIRTAVRSGQHEIAWKTAATLWAFFYLRKHWPEWIEAFDIGMQAARQDKTLTGEAWMLTFLGLAYCDLREFDRAYDFCRRAMDRWKTAEHRWGEGISLILLGMIHYGVRRFFDAAAVQQVAIDLVGDFNDEWAISNALTMLGNTHRELLRPDEAIACYGQALIIAQNGGNRYAEALALSSLGETKASLGQPEAALEYYSRALSIWREIGNRQGEGRTLFGTGKAHHDRAHLAAARQAWRDAVAVFDELGDPQAVDVRVLLEGLED